MDAPAADAALTRAIFHPRAIALIGATADQTKNNSRAQRLLQRAGYAGRIIPVNPRGGEIMGVPAVPDIRAAEGEVDHAFLMVPASAVPDAIRGCISRGVKVATLYSAGFAEVGAEGAARQDEIVAIARAGGMRLIGPNCLGLVNVTDGVPITNNAVVEAETLRPGWISVVSQSGSMMGALMARCMARGLNFAKLASLGNEADIGAGELAGLLVEDPATEAVLMFLETLRDAPLLARAARRAHELGKPIIAYKLGRSEVGRRIAVSHTGAIVGADELAATFFRENGILRVDTLEGLVELPRLVRGRRPPRGRRVAALTGTGGGAGMVVDRLGTLGVDVVTPSPDLRTELAAEGIAVGDSPLIDLPMGGGRGHYLAVFKALQASKDCDAVLAVLGSNARLWPAQVNDILLDGHDGTKPVAVFCAPQADATLAILDAAGVAGFRTPETCADALAAFVNWRTPMPRPAARPEAWREAAAAVAATRKVRLNEAEACAVFASLGIEGPGARVVRTPEEAAGMPGPAAVKILSAEIAHKTDAGLVRLNVTGATAIREAVAGMLARAREAFPEARIEGVLVAPMHQGLVEVILGFQRDPEVGPVVLLGMGGVLAELRQSHVVRLAPVSEAVAREMIAELPELRLIAGYRNLPRGDVAALARAVVAMSHLACLDDPAVAEAEINPLIVRAEGQGVVAVDGLLVTTRAEGDCAP